MYLACYEVMTGDNYAGGLEKRYQLLDHPYKALGLPNLKSLWRIDSYTEISQDEISAAREAKANQEAEIARFFRVNKLKRELAELEGK